jgi:hypothetical protein
MIGLVIVGEVNVKFDARYVEPTEPAVAGIAFSTLETLKLSTIIVSPADAALFKTIVVPLEAV